MLLLTGQRRNEVSGMKWSEIDTKTGTWVIPSLRTKNKREHIVYLSDQALMILGRMPVLESDYVFTTTLISPLSGYGRAKERLDKELEIPHWTLHDLRRTFVTISNERGLADPHVIEAAVNHLTGAAKAGVAGVYNRAAYLTERQQLFKAWGEYIEGLVTPKAEQPKPANIIAFNSGLTHRL
jgi:integrase